MSRYGDLSTDLRDQFVGAMRRVASSVSVVTTEGDAGRFGVTVASMTSVSADPPMLLVCMPRDHLGSRALLANGVFAVNVLAADQVEVAASFSGRPLRGLSYHFKLGQWREAPPAAPLLLGAAASFTCTLLEAHEGGTHSIFMGSVTGPKLARASRCSTATSFTVAIPYSRQAESICAATPDSQLRPIEPGRQDESGIMIRTGEEYRASLQDGREVWVDGERVKDVTRHPAMKPLVDIRARIYDMQHEPAICGVMSYSDPATGDTCAQGSKLPHTQEDWQAKRLAVDTVLNEIGGVVVRVGDETVGEMWSLYDGRDVLNEVDPQFARNIETHIHKVIAADPFHVSANTDPKGDRSKRPQDQDPDMLLHLVKETDAGIVVRGAKYETAAAYANQAFVKPTIANWGDDKLSDYALGFICDMGAPASSISAGKASPEGPGRISALHPL